MPYLKQIDRSATGAFCPHAPYLAAGTVAGAIDISFSTSSVLEIFPLDFSSTSDYLSPCGSIAAPERFNRFAWGQHLPDQSFQKHTGAVKGLEFNGFSPNLLASGAADSDLCIWDLTKPSTPSLYPALKGGAGAPGSAVGGEITYLAWNRKVQHILASCSTNGTTVVWDLKRQKPVISFRDTNSQRRASAIQWNPDIATQLIVASDDDRSPTLQMWDLRNSVSPLKEFVGHHKGVLALAWSPHDSSLLLSSGKDNRTICWDVQSGDIVCELSSANWNFDVQWSPTVPGIFATSSFDGKLGVCNLHTCTGSKVTETVNADFTVTQSIVGDAKPLTKAPAWMRRPVGATFGFGGRLVSFTNNRSQQTDPATGAVRLQDTGIVAVKQVVTEQDLVSRSEGFEAAIQGGNLQTLREYCCTKRAVLSSADIQSAEAKQEVETWAFLSVLFEGDDARRVLLQTLGFKDLPTREGSLASAPTENGVDAAAAGVQQLSLQGADGVSCLDVPGANTGVALAAKSPHELLGQDDPSFFDKLEDSGDVLGGPVVTADSAAAASPDLGTLKLLGTGAIDAMARDAREQFHGRCTYFGALSEMGMPAMKSLSSFTRHCINCTCTQRFVVPRSGEAAAALSAITAGPPSTSPLSSSLSKNEGLSWPRSSWGLLAASATPVFAPGKAGGDGHGHVPDHVPGGELEAEIVKALTVGCYATAVEHCLAVHRYADALLIANTAGRDLYQRTMHSYMQKCPHPYQAIIRANLEGDYNALIRTRPVAQWRETLAMLVTYTDRDKFRGLADTLASRLAQAGMHHEASLCWVCGGHTDQAVSYWARNCTGGSTMKVEVLQNVIEKAVVMGMAPGVSSTSFPDGVNKASQSLSELVTAYASLLASNGRMATALDYLEHVPGEASTTVAVLKDRIYRSGVAELPHGVHPPPFPFVREEVVPAAQPAPQQAAQSGNAYSAYGASYSATTAAAPATSQYGAYGQQGQQQVQPQTFNTSQTAYSKPQQTYNVNAYGQAQATQYASAAPAQQYNTAPAPQAGPASQYGQQQATNPYASQTAAQTQASGYGQYGQYQQTQQQPSTYTSASSTLQPSQQATYASANSASAYQQQRPTQAVAPAPFTPTSVVPPVVPQAQQSVPPPQVPAMSTSTPYTTAVAPSAFVPTPAQQAMPPGHTTAAVAPQPSFFVPRPPANISVATADTSAVPADLRPVVISLTNLYNACIPLANNPAKKREMDDNTKKIGQLFWKLNSGEVSASVVPKLQQLCAAIDAGDWHTANHIQVQMTTTDWDECGFWLSAVKRMIKLRQTS
ncbi:hypothetical protein VOLCADRAFT_120559 [Volvox carteri f. nagariensis]|uniref:Uncharacterized protein n=1 Tax=Volvox carteri f. nagariensis TaxID=3068 RepID=D8TN82_VOLCA|nr:uncharacterized protein VOLCADRAFT_120559 [Volvox carteri f. nagariensis]EFJ51095.1 hypothetical protein VOLCADRAFT_120559 [Volvox carteri f. nagariensis]|eukprot:XP_002948107.1 hypothetical protein VOLCADRAFT_120559 [Volvox carteri f. nagariensis]